jgi:hypothetical protein
MGPLAIMAQVLSETEDDRKDMAFPCCDHKAGRRPLPTLVRVNPDSRNNPDVVYLVKARVKQKFRPS